MRLKEIMGSGRKIWITTLPFLIVGVILNILFPEVFSVGGPSTALRIISIIILIIGIIVWIWSASLILAKAPKKQLITTGPYSIVKHPLYIGFALLIFPWIGFLLDTWLGIVIGVIMYVATRIFAPEEEKKLSKMYGKSWDNYSKNVLMPWL